MQRIFDGGGRWGARRRASSVARCVGLAGGVGFLLATASVAGATTTCGPDQTISDTTINGNVFVPSNVVFSFGRGCTLTNVLVNGVVTIAPGGELDADQTTIKGGLTANDAFDMDLFEVTVYGPTKLTGGNADSTFDEGTFVGSVTIQDTVFTPDRSLDFSGNRVDGSVRLVNNATPLAVEDNNISGSLTVTGNHGGASIAGNTIRALLSCSGNAPPFTGSGNTAASKTGQCAGF